MEIRFRRMPQQPSQGQQPNHNANAAAPHPVGAGAPISRATFNLRHHIIFWVVLFLFGLLYLHIGHRISYEPAALYSPRLFWRSVGAEISMAITRAAVWCHNMCKRFQV